MENTALSYIFAKINTARRAEIFFEYRAEFEQNKGVRAEF